jgi:transposase
MTPRRPLSTDEKVALIQRLKSGVSVPTLARESGLLRKSLYEWQAAYAAFGAAGLNRKRGPKSGGRASGGPTAAAVGPPDARPPDDLAEAKARIAERERVIGRQQVALDFFREALRSWDAKRRSSAATISSDSSDK